MISEIKKLKNLIVEKYSPNKIILFGSQGKGTENKHSDIDLCVIMKKIEDKDELLDDMNYELYIDKPFDIILYTQNEWNSVVKDTTSFAYLINKTGVELYQNNKDNDVSLGHVK